MKKKELYYTILPCEKKLYYRIITNEKVETKFFSTTMKSENRKRKL
jgi:hypothetical protein